MKVAALSATLVLVLAGTGLAETTPVGTIAVAESADATAARPSFVGTEEMRARVTTAAATDGRVLNALAIEFRESRRAASVPLQVWTGQFATRVDLAAVAWDGAGARRAARGDAAAAPEVPIARRLADLAWSAGVVERLPTLCGGDVGPRAEFVIEAVSTPEPAAAALFALGAAGLAVVACRRRRAARSPR